MIVLFLLGCGIKTLMDVHSNPAPQVITYAQFSQLRPSSGWYRVTGCRLDLSKAVIEEQNNVPVRAFVPVFDVHNPQQKTTHIFAEMDDRKTTVLFLDQGQQERYHSKEEQRQWQAAHQSEFTLQRDVSGLARKGVRYMQDVRSEFGPVVDSDLNELVVIAADWKPNTGLGVAELIAGGLFLILIVFLARRKA